MARPLDQANEQQQPGQQVEYSAEDVELAVRMGVQAIEQGKGIEVIKTAIQQSQEPGKVISKFLAQLMGQLAEKLRDELGINPGIFIAKNGFLDQILDYIEQKLGYPAEFSDQIYHEVLETIKAAAQNPPPANPTAMGMGPQAPQGQPPQQGGV